MASSAAGPDGEATESPRRAGADDVRTSSPRRQRAAVRPDDAPLRLADPPTNACATWRADWTAFVEPTALPVAPPSAVASEPPADALHVDGAVVVSLVGRLTHVTPELRPQLAADAAHVWESLTGTLGEHTASAVAARMRAWSPDDPDLEAVRCLLTAAQELEWRRLMHQANAVLGALLHLLRSAPTTRRSASRRRTPDVRRAHVLAQRARVLRTSGALDDAEASIREATTIARRARDQWLEARCLLGEGAVHEMRGNVPAARERYERALTIARSLDAAGADLVSGARHGLTWVAILSGRHEDALRECWAAFRGAGRDPFTRGVMLSMLACVALNLGRPRAALRAARAAMTLEPISANTPGILASAVRAAELLGETASADAYAARLLEAIRLPNADPYTVGDAFRDLAIWSLDRAYRAADAPREAVAYAEAGLAIATRHGYHELAFTLDPVLARARGDGAPTASPRRLSRESCALLDDTEALPLSADLLLAVA